MDGPVSSRAALERPGCLGAAPLRSAPAGAITPPGVFPSKPAGRSSRDDEPMSSVLLVGPALRGGFLVALLGVAAHVDVAGVVHREAPRAAEPRVRAVVVCAYTSRAADQQQ